MIKQTIENNSKDLYAVNLRASNKPNIKGELDYLLVPRKSELSERVTKNLAMQRYNLMMAKHGKELSKVQNIVPAKIVEKHPNSQFRKRKADGEIVFQDYTIGQLRSGYGKKDREIYQTRALFQGDSSLGPFERRPDYGWYILHHPISGEIRYWTFTTDEGCHGGGDIRITTEVFVEKIPNQTDINMAKLIKLMKTPTNPEGRLVTAAVADLNNKTLDLLTNVAELPETVGFIIDVLHKILRLCLQFKKEIIKTGKDILKPDTYASLWLQYRYALMPMVYTVKDGLKVLDELYMNEYVDSKKKIVIRKQSPLDDRFEESVTHRCYIKRRYSIEDLEDALSSHMSINPFVTAWELVTLSFVVDWVLNIGDYVSALTSPETFTQQNATYSIKQVCKDSTNDEYLEYEIYKRFLINPKSHLTIDFKPTMNYKRWADAVALAKVILLSKK